MSQIGPDHYRYFATLDDRGVRIRCERFIVIGETPLCWYVVPDRLAYLIGSSWDRAPAAIKSARRRVLKESSGRRHCYPDKIKALESFIARQTFRIRHARRSLSTAELSMKVAKRLLDAGELPDDHQSHPCGHNKYTASLNWSDC